MTPELIRAFLSQTRVLRAPSRALSTFGATIIPYHLISPVENFKDKTRLRQGTVHSRKPQILTAESFAQRFEGFGDEAREFGSWLNSTYGELLRALEYNFKNDGSGARVMADKPRDVAERIAAELDESDARDQAIILCPDAAWSLALMKLALDETARSFPVNVRDLERRGMFDLAGREESRRRKEIEGLFASARANHEARDLLGRKLHEYGLFAEYEDRFLSLFGVRH